MMKGLMKRMGGFELSFTKKLHRGQKGFTLMELLIVVAILGVLAAVVIPRFTGLIGRGADEAAATELEVVQTAMVAAMTAAPVSAVTAQATDLALDSSSTAPAAAPIGPYLQTATKYMYTWDTLGIVVQGAEAPAS
jgi:prepilin-type N-terminal cleavage/methylation domain-containing protein